MNFRSLKQNSKLKKIFERIPRINKFIRKIEKNIDFTSLEITRQGNSNYDAKSFQMNATETRKNLLHSKNSKKDIFSSGKLTPAVTKRFIPPILPPISSHAFRVKARDVLEAG